MVTTDASPVPLPKEPVDWDALPKIIIDWEVGFQHGWGIHGYQLAKRIVEREIAVPLLIHKTTLTIEQLQPILVPMKQIGDMSLFPRLRAGHNRPAGHGTPQVNIGDGIVHVFEEPVHSTEDLEFLQAHGERVVCLSQWNADVLKAQGIPAECHHMGVDTTLFKAQRWGERFGAGRFVIFSGGKIEYRKGHDIVIAAFKAFQQKHKDALLVTMWHNHWPETARSLSQSPYTRRQPLGTGTNPLIEELGKPVRLDIPGWLNYIGVPVGSHEELGVVSRQTLAALLGSVNVALFPNRCEAGTNLVAMECLASAVPVILSNNTGHSDLINHPITCYELEEQTPCTAVEFEGTSSFWRESSVDEIVAALEYVYDHASEARRTGIVASEIMQQPYWSWPVRMDAQIAKLEIGRDHGAFAKAVAATKRAMPSDQAKLASEYAQYATKLRDNNHIALAVSVAHRAANMSPKDPHVLGNLGNVLITAHNPSASRHYTEQAVQLEPRLEPVLRHNIGLSMAYNGQIEAALREFTKVKDKSLDLIFDTACCLMLLGRWKEGWREFEVRRLRSPEFHEKQPMPEWQGQNIQRDPTAGPIVDKDYPHGGTLWVTCEQGIGDTFMFARYLPWARERCNKLIFSVYPSLMPMFYNFPGVDEVRSFDVWVPPPQADFHAPMMSLATFHGTMPDTVPFVPDHFTKMVKKVQANLHGPEGYLKVGLCWAGSKVHPRDFERSIPLPTMFPILEVPGVQFYSLQVGDRAGDLVTHGADKLISDITSALTTWPATGAALKKLDLLITVDTAIAHMAGALDVPTWMLVCKMPDWRWMMRSDETPWYPSVTIIRQKLLGDWRGVVLHVRDKLQALRKRTNA